MGGIVPIVVLVGVLISCSKPDFVGVRPHDDAQLMTTSTALQPVNYGRSIVVQGKVVEVCQEEGCWMVITDGSTRLRMSFKDEAFTVPMHTKGEVVVEGTINEDIFDEESSKAIAATLGLTQPLIDSIHGDKRIPIMTAVGVRFLNME